ncbi:MAG: TrkH family potassium uptake protein [Bacteroidales bacterium]|nr:TrkH family potassium uptake protein [Bacteroidales bacterium]
MANNIINFRIAYKVISKNLFIVGFALLFSILIALIYSEAIWPFALSASLAFLFGWILTKLKPAKENGMPIQKRDAYFAVTFSWLLISLIGSLPYLFSGTIPSVIDAIFESVSGFTTTGSSILTDIEALPKSILFWRSLTHWIGGIGIIVLVIVVMPSLQIGGYQLFTLESSLQEKIQPRIKSVGFRLLVIYLILTVAEIALLLLGGMNLYESVCHAFGTIATGGFSPKNTSIAGYSPYIQYVVMIFMLLAGTNFVIHYYFLKRQFKKIKRNDELKFYLLMVFGLGTLITATLFFNMQKPLEESFREAFFQVISIVTCTGYATADYMQWPLYAWLIIFFAMFLGGSTGSTAGGIKMARHLLLFKNIGRIFRKLASPKAIIVVRLNKAKVSEEMNSSIMTFITVYLLIFAAGSLLLVFNGVDGQTAASSVATCMAGIGPGLGSVGPVGNFAHLPALSKIILSFLMIVGRLEIYTVFMLFSKSFWRR